MGAKQVALITGNQGFVGVWVTLFMKRAGWEVFGLDNRTSLGERLWDQLEMDSKIQGQYSQDICDVSGLVNIMRETKPNLVINLAGQAIVPRAFREPFETYRTNTLGTLSVLEAARQSMVPKAVVCITSDKVYKNNEQVWPYRESDELGGKDIYSVSKSSAELICYAYSKTHLRESGINIQSVRLGNVVGGGDWSKDRLIPDLMNAVKTGNGQFLIRYPEATRPFQHVLDVADGILKISNAALSEKIGSGEMWNLGPKDNTFARVKDVVALCKGYWPTLKIDVNPAQIAEDLNLSVEIAKFRSIFGAPQFTSSAALEMAINWYKNYFEKLDLETLIQRDFDLFEAKNA